MAYVEAGTPKSCRIAGDEEDGVGDASLVALERHEPDHRHDVLRMPRTHDKVFAMRRT